MRMDDQSNLLSEIAQTQTGAAEGGQQPASARRSRKQPSATPILHFLSTQAFASPFDVNMAVDAGFKVVETRERRVLLSQAAVRAISSYAEFAKGALHASEEDADEASRALRVTVQQTFRDLSMKYLPRNWLEILAVKP